MTRKRLHDNGLTLVFLGLFVLALVGQAFAGWREFVGEQESHGQPPVSLGRYLVSSSFGADVVENWQSEFMQFALLIFLSVWFIQRGSAESKKPGSEGAESDKEQKVGAYAHADSPLWARVGGLRTRIFSNSLLLLMLSLWLLSWIVQSITGWRVFNDEQAEHQETLLSYGGYLTSADFWNRTLQNWQSEMLAVASMAIFSVFLRQRGSEQSKAVGDAHAATGGET